jgi:hypothetical protein
MSTSPRKPLNDCTPRKVAMGHKATLFDHLVGLAEWQAMKQTAKSLGLNSFRRERLFFVRCDLSWSSRLRIDIDACQYDQRANHSQH